MPPNCNQQKVWSFITVISLIFTIYILFYYQHTWPLDTARSPGLKNSIFLKLTPSTSGVTRKPKENICKKTFSSIFQNLIKTYRSCLLQYLENKSKWNEFGKAIETCLGSTLWNILDVQTLKNQDDMKFIILPSNRNKSQFDCIEITLGIGNDIDSEIKLRQLLPDCRFYGADPIRSSGQIFQKLGPYFEIAVSSKSGIITANVLENGVYQQKRVPALTILDFFENYTKVDHIDYFLLDAEGVEYGIFQELFPGGSLDNSNISICQISVEMHGPPSYHKMENRIDHFLTRTINETAFLPIWSWGPNVHLRSFYVNVRDPYCIEKFFLSKVCY